MEQPKANVADAGQSVRVDCTVVIVAYNSAQDIVRLLESLPASVAGLTSQTFVVDNGSTDATVELVRGFPGVNCVPVRANLGYAGAINVARRVAGEYRSLLVLNPDLALEPGAVRQMFTALSNPGTGIVVPRLVDLDGHCLPSLRREPTLMRAVGDGLLGNRLSGRPGWLSEIVREKSAYASRHCVDWATGAALLISAACDRSVGQWDERFFLYSEETDYAARARAAGFRVEYLPTAVARHRGGGSGQSRALTALMAVNRVRYMEKHGSRARTYRAAVALAEAMRSRDPGHWTALRTVLRRKRWTVLIQGLKAAPTDDAARPPRDELPGRPSDSPDGVAPSAAPMSVGRLPGVGFSEVRGKI